MNINKFKHLVLLLSFFAGIYSITDSWAREGDVALIEQIERDAISDVPIVDILKKNTSSGMDTMHVISALISSGTDPYLVVYTAITEGLPAQQVVSAAIKAKAPLNEVVKAAVIAGADKQLIAKGAAESGIAPALIANVIASVSAPASPVYGYSSASDNKLSKSNMPQGLRNSEGRSNDKDKEDKEHPTKPGTRSKPHKHK